MIRMVNLWKEHATYVVHDGRPRRHGYDGEHCEHRQSDVIEHDDPVSRTDPVLRAVVIRRTAKATDKHAVAHRTRVHVVILVQVVQS